MPPIDDKTKTALHGYIIATANSTTKHVDQHTPLIRSHIEAGDYRKAIDILDAARAQLSLLRRELHHGAELMAINLYPEDDGPDEEKAPYDPDLGVPKYRGMHARKMSRD